jgi:hypothetical protein
MTKGARIRATRWLAMTVGLHHLPPPRPAPPRLPATRIVGILLEKQDAFRRNQSSQGRGRTP